MPIVCGVRFRGAGKIYYFSPDQIQDLAVNDQVIVETARGIEMGQVAMASQEMPPDKVVGQLKPVMRRATTADLLDAQRYRAKEDEAVALCKEQVARSNLPMKVVQAEYNYDGTRLTFCFTSEQRVDFRELVRELAHLFKTRIELRQIGVRDEAKLTGGIGKCGRPLCCATWLSEFAPVSIRMAKQQDLPLSPMEISGLCGRLLCCLAYESDFYKEVKGKFPKVGKMIDTPAGPARIVKIHVFKETADALLEDGSVLELTADQVSGKEPITAEPRAAGLNGSQQQALGRLVDDGGPETDLGGEDADEPLEAPDDDEERAQPPRRRSEPAPANTAPSSAPREGNAPSGGGGQRRQPQRPRPSQSPRRDQPADQQPPANAPSRGQSSPAEGQGQGPSKQGQNRPWPRRRRRPSQGGQPSSGDSGKGEGV
jgi:cell fate regulator YaaT (PSP1 superfamily)